MCGIAGCYSPGGLGPEALAAVQRMTAALAHRGPDASDQWLDLDTGVALGHRRLSILDLTPTGTQPMVSASGRYVVTFNGEFYNWAELRAEEERHGARWRGRSDTEVFLTCCDRLGVRAAVTRCSGMFALGIWDRQQRELTLARDRIGEKPLYYGWVGKTLLFGSELKALRAHPQWDGHIDRGALGAFFRNGYVPGPASIYHNVRKLAPGSTVTISENGSRWPEPERFWSLRDVVSRGQADPFMASEDELVTQFDQLLGRVVEEEMVADVPLGAFLSGGIDSSLIVALMQRRSPRPIRTFTIGFEEQAYDETAHGLAVARHLGTDHTGLRLTPTEALAIFPQLPAMYDEPIADVSQLPTHLVSRLAREQVTVVLSGDGGDELFGGYGRYHFADSAWRWLSRLPRPIRHSLIALAATPSSRVWDVIFSATGLRQRGITGDRVHKFADLAGLPSRDRFYRHLTSHWKRPGSLLRCPEAGEDVSDQALPGDASLDFIQEMMMLDAISYLPDNILARVDRAAMAVSLEVRAPLLHHEVVEWTARVPVHRQVRGGVGKLILRRLLDRYVPRSLVDRPKLGFSVPIAEWFRGPLRPWLEQLRHLEGSPAAEYLDPAPVRQAVDDHLNHNRNRHYELWTVLSFVSWLEAQGSHQLPTRRAG